MTWNPQATVTINGTNYTSESLGGVTISFGRTSVWEQPRTSYAIINILNATNTDFGFDMNQSVVITAKNSAGTNVTLFTGKVNQVTNTVSGAGANLKVAVQQITAIGSFAIMARTILAGVSYPKEMDTVRLTTILNSAGVTIDVIDSPAIYEFAAVSAPTTDAYTMAANYAQQAFGYIYETPSGKVGFANESRRSIDVTANGYMNIPRSYINWQSVSSQKSLADIANNVDLTWRAGTETATDTVSQGYYGTKSASVNTELHNNSDAILQVNRYLDLRSLPRTSLSNFTIQLDSTLLSNADRNTFLAGMMGEPIQILNLPLAIKNQTYRGFVEGYSFQISRTQMTMTLITSDYTYSIAPTRWQDVSAALIWSAVPATKTWVTYDD
jgi:hypothetical protein